MSRRGFLCTASASGQDSAEGGHESTSAPSWLGKRHLVLGDRSNMRGGGRGCGVERNFHGLLKEGRIPEVCTTKCAGAMVTHHEFLDGEKLGFSRGGLAHCKTSGDKRGEREETEGVPAGHALAFGGILGLHPDPRDAGGSGGTLLPPAERGCSGQASRGHERLCHHGSSQQDGRCRRSLHLFRCLVSGASTTTVVDGCVPPMDQRDVLSMLAC